MSKTKELSEALAYEPKPRTIDDVTREALAMLHAKDFEHAKAMKGNVPGAKLGDTLVIRRLVPYKPQ